MVKQPTLVLGSGEQAGVALKLTDQEFVRPIMGQPFSGSFAVRNLGPPYRVEPGIAGPQFGIYIYRGDELLYRKFGSWMREQSQTQIVHVEWSTERQGRDGYSTPFLVAPGPGVYRCRIELFAGSERQRLLDTWETSETLK